MLVALTAMQVAGLMSEQRGVTLKNPLGGGIGYDSLCLLVAAQMVTLCFVVD